METDGEPRQLGIDDSGKRRNLPRCCWLSLGRYRKRPLDIQHFHWKPPFVARRNTAVRPQAANWPLSRSQTQRVRQEHRQQIPSSRAEKRSFCIKGTAEGEEIVSHRRRCRAARSSVWLEVPGMNWWIKFRIACPLRAWLEGRPAVGLLRSARGRFPSMAEGAACYRVPRLSRPL